MAVRRGRAHRDRGGGRLCGPAQLLGNGGEEGRRSCELTQAPRDLGEGSVLKYAGRTVRARKCGDPPVRVNLARPKRVPTLAQERALERAMAARSTCPECKRRTGSASTAPTNSASSPRRTTRNSTSTSPRCEEQDLTPAGLGQAA
ncbi:hypothetical protein F0344_34510 (plasmid) [Streptomyces finlayi]|uniref:Uncharacterized protein n=1 Tax=Streptomyces finlayi TaxID=67296 RepID=A0A7G7BW70_9ACTN|nr:hypothetical protein F0344_34510 [Streptomyces finlayi]